MAIKVTVDTPNITKITYPRVCCYKEDRTLIALFTAEGRGICLAPATYHSFGKETSGWDKASKWEPICVTIDSTGEV